MKFVTHWIERFERRPIKLSTAQRQQHQKETRVSDANAGDTSVHEKLLLCLKHQCRGEGLGKMRSTPCAIKTVKVSNVSLGATEQDIREFFSFSGEIQYVELRSHDERSQIAYVTFKDSQGAETAVLLSGATIVDLSVTITLDPEYQLPPAALASSETESRTPRGAESALGKAEDVVTSMLAKGFVLGKDAVNKAKTFDEKHQLTSTASAKVASFDQKIGLSEKITAGASVVSDRVREVDQKFHVSEKTKTAFAAAEQKVSDAGSAIMKNRYILTGASWVTGAFSKVAKAAGDVGQKTKDKVENAESGTKAQGSVNPGKKERTRVNHVLPVRPAPLGLAENPKTHSWHSIPFPTTIRGALTVPKSSCVPIIGASLLSCALTGDALYPTLPPLPRCNS
ncbi:binding partner of ACD11 1-like [Senna tora]|uniref:Binding partner of ACD11 1-like n=1 Tax=Senna tora TaxID=362788 RepID=A0A834TVA5_9FABA|nr:binding partner of ACD11 1-like [Senna tora]